MSNNFKERRKFVRFRLPFCAKCIADRNREFYAVTRDISYEGARLIIDTPQQLPKNYRIYLEIVFPNQTLRFSAQLIWTKEYPEQRTEAGFHFLESPSNYKEIIYNYIIKHNLSAEQPHQ